DRQHELLARHVQLAGGTVEAVEDDSLDDAARERVRLARVGEMDLTCMRGAFAELDADEDRRRCEECEQHLHRISLHERSAAPAANAAARKNEERNARVIVV